MRIISNGSKWAGDDPDSVEKLIEVLGKETLEPIFERYGNFVTVSGGDVHAFGNFRTVSHVFNIHGSAEEMRPLVEAIEAAMRRPEYVRIAEHHRKVEAERAAERSRPRVYREMHVASRR